MESKLTLGNMSEMLQYSMQCKVPVSILLQDSIEELCVIGTIDYISQQYGRFKVGDDWFHLDDIERIELCPA